MGFYILECYDRVATRTASPPRRILNLRLPSVVCSRGTTALSYLSSTTAMNSKLRVKHLLYSNSAENQHPWRGVIAVPWYILEFSLVVLGVHGVFAGDRSAPSNLNGPIASSEHPGQFITTSSPNCLQKPSRVWWPWKTCEYLLLGMPLFHNTWNRGLCFAWKFLFFAVVCLISLFRAFSLRLGY